MELSSRRFTPLYGRVGPVVNCAVYTFTASAANPIVSIESLREGGICPLVLKAVLLSGAVVQPYGEGLREAGWCCWSQEVQPHYGYQKRANGHYCQYHGGHRALHNAARDGGGIDGGGADYDGGSDGGNDWGPTEEEATEEEEEEETEAAGRLGARVRDDEGESARR